VAERPDYTHARFTGLRNVVGADGFSQQDLEVATNVDIDDEQSVMLRRGYGAPVLGGAYHSLWSNGAVCLAVVGGALVRIVPGYSVQTLRTGLFSTEPMAYVEIGGRVYYSNGTDTGCVADGASRTWGMQVPGALTAVASGGSLPAGRYQFAMTFLRNDEQESGASVAGVVDVVAGGIAFTSLPVSSDPDVYAKVLYVTKQGGDTFYRAAVLPNSTLVAVVEREPVGIATLITQHLRPAPAGQCLGYHAGSALVASGSRIYPSQPFAPELFDLRRAMPMPDRVSMIAPVKSGVFVGTGTSIVWLAGADFKALDYRKVAAYGVIPGTLAYCDASVIGDGSRKGVAAMWASTRGLCVGFDDGSLENLTQTRFAYPVQERGTAIVRQHRGMNQFIAVLQGVETPGNTA